MYLFSAYNVLIFCILCICCRYYSTTVHLPPLLLTHPNYHHQPLHRSSTRFHHRRDIYANIHARKGYPRSRSRKLQTGHWQSQSTLNRSTRRTLPSTKLTNANRHMQTSAIKKRHTWTPCLHETFNCLPVSTRRGRRHLRAHDTRLMHQRPPGALGRRTTKTETFIAAQTSAAGKLATLGEVS